MYIYVFDHFIAISEILGPDLKSQDNVKQVLTGVKKLISEYRMESVPRGTCLIISNECFDPEDLSDRKGTDLDAKNLEETFRWLQFEVNTHSNLSAIDMWEVISQYSKKSYDRYDCFVCCILSHGSSGGFYTEIQGKPMFLERSGAGSIYGTDGKLIPTECLRKLFLGSHCASLHGKPKLFFIQACRGPRIDTGNPTGTWLHVAADGPSDCQDILTEEAGKFLASDSDFACVYATVPGIVF